MKVMASPLQVPVRVEDPTIVRMQDITPSEEVKEMVGKLAELPEIDLAM